MLIGLPESPEISGAARERSSFGKGEIYDGSFSKTLTKGNGILVRMLSDEGIAVYTENEIDELIKQKTEGNL